MSPPPPSRASDNCPGATIVLGPTHIPLPIGEYFLQLPHQRGQVLFHRLPEDVQVQEIVAVDQAMSHVDDFRPRDSFPPLTELFGDLRCRLTDELHKASQGASPKAHAATYWTWASDITSSRK